MPVVRPPVVNGQFYPSRANEIRKMATSFLEEKKEIQKKEVIACLLPHAGYIYSGRVATLTLASIQIKQRIILLGPNHTGYGAEFSVFPQGYWRTPLGDVEIDAPLVKKLLSRSNYLQEDELAHRYEHSLEVELPLLQFFRSDFKIVPITILSADSSALNKLGQEIASVVKEMGIEKETLLVVSSDMTHYESQKDANRKDRLAIEAILNLDPLRLQQEVHRFDISMCGYAPAVCMLAYARQEGAKTGELIAYQTSGDVTGDYSSVVGYAGIIIY